MKSGGSTLKLVLILIAVIGGLAIIDLSLAKTERLELESEAKGLYTDGRHLLHTGKPAEAVDLLRKAHSLERQNVNYQAELLEALIASGQLQEAESAQDELLDRQPNDGKANLLAARLMVREKKLEEAKSYYHRAIYGAWTQDSSNRRLEARLELVDLLSKSGAQRELLAELLPLEGEIPYNDVAMRRRLAGLFLVANSPSRAADVFRSILAANRNDPEAYAGLGNAELALGNYRGAVSAFLNAFHLDPDNTGLRQRMELSSTMSTLDPTPRQLSSREKYRRSLRILEFSRDSLTRCLVDHSDDAARRLINQATVELEQGLTETQPANEVAEAVLALAEQSWKARVKLCGTGVPSGEQALGLVMERLAQSSSE